MSSTDEPDYFHWHCEVAALVMNTLPGNAATKHHIRNALRLATMAASGLDGIAYASEKALSIKAASAKGWRDAELIKEHVVPISEIYDQVIQAFAFPVIRTGGAGPIAFMPPEERRKKLQAGQSDLFLGNPRPWQIARVLREWNVQAYITREEDQLLRQHKLHKHMPKHWDGQDKFARYDICRIKLVDIP